MMDPTYCYSFYIVDSFSAAWLTMVQLVFTVCTRFSVKLFGFPLVADLFLYCYERDFMDSLNHDNQADVIEAHNSTSRYLDDFLTLTTLF